MPSNSMKTFLLALSRGIVKCFRYQAMPVDRSLMSLRKASSSFHACGVVTGRHFESSNAAELAPAGSPTSRSQSELKLYLVRGAAANVITARHSRTRQKSDLAIDQFPSGLMSD